MSMLERYRKPGGFIQLVSLIETCSPEKQTKLLDTVASEDRLWADTVRAKLLTIDRILAWGDDTLMEVFGTLQDVTVAVTLNAANEELKARLSKFVSHGRRRKIEDLYGSKVPTAGEVAASYMRIIESVRKMGMDGVIRFDKCDPALVIDEQIDDRLSRRSSPAAQASSEKAAFGAGGEENVTVLHSYSHMSAHTAAHQPVLKADNSDPRILELHALRKKVVEMSKETAVLRHELSVARNKLEQIKKLA